jgi:hypothetical protein
MSTLPPVSIIVLNYNGRRFLDGCLSALLDQAYPIFEVLVVDNGSSDGSAEFIRKEFPTVRLMALPVNLGFAGGNNRGVEESAYDLIVLLNNDTQVEPDWLLALVEGFRPEDVGVASSLIRTKGIPEKYYEKNGSVNFLGHNIMRVFDKREDIFFAGGASLIYSKGKLGAPFDTDYFAYAEDVSLSLRARFLGLRVVHVHGSVVQHHGSGTTDRQPVPFITFLQERNRLLNLLTFFSRATIVKIAPLILVNAAAKLSAACLGKKYSTRGLLHAYFWLLTHPAEIAAKRRAIRSAHLVHERDVIRWMTYKLTNGESWIGTAINAIVHLYFKAVGLHTVEMNEI